jgi:hypothetical protein
MPNSVNNVVVGKPLVTGGCLVAPRGSALPGDALRRLIAAYVAVGYLTDSGVVKTEKRNTGTVTAWGGDTIAVTKKGFDVQVKVGLAEYLNATVKALVYGTANVSTLAFSAGLAAPVITLGATAGTGGTFTAGTKYWKVSAINANGETLPSNEVSATLTSTSTQVINWTAVGGATGYNIYRGVIPGQENVLVATVGAVATYTDTGTTGTAQQPLLVDSTGRGNQVTTIGTSQPSPRNTWVFEIFSDTGRKVRVVFPDLAVMDIDDVTYKDDDITALTLTLQAFPDASGNYFYEYADDGIRV